MHTHLTLPVHRQQLVKRNRHPLAVAHHQIIQLANQVINHRHRHQHSILSPIPPNKLNTIKRLRQHLHQLPIIRIIYLDQVVCPRQTKVLAVKRYMLDNRFVVDGIYSLAIHSITPDRHLVHGYKYQIQMRTPCEYPIRVSQRQRELAIIKCGHHWFHNYVITTQSSNLEKFFFFDVFTLSSEKN